MSTGAIFNIITNDGKQDRMLMASAILEKRLKAIREAKANTADPNPTLMDIEKTHLLFVNAHFKPFAAIGFEYNRVQPQSGNPQYGQRVQYNIPQFGDFFCDMGLHVQLNEVEAVSATSVGTANAPAVRYCDYPGERLLQRVQMEINGNPLDEYFSNTMTAHRQFSVQPNKLTAYKRCMGQEVADEAYLDQAAATSNSWRQAVTLTNGAQTPKTRQSTLEMFIPLMFWYNKDVRLAIPSVSIPQGQRFINVDFASVAQMLCPVNRGSAALSAANGGLTNDAAVQAVGGGVPTFARADLYINNIFVNPEVHDIYISRVGFSLIRVHRHHNAALTVSESNIQLTQLKWPVESLFVGFKPSANTNLAGAPLKVAQDWHRYSNVDETAVTVSVDGTTARRALLDTVVAFLTASAGGAAAELQDLTGVAPDFVAFHSNAVVATGQIRSPVTGLYVSALAAAGGGLVAPATSLKAGGAGVPLTAPEYANVTGLVNTFLAATGANDGTVARVRRALPMTATLKISAHGIPLYNDLPAQFFNSYTPYVFGGHQLNAPSDPGAYFIPFCLYPGTYQPSGHINVSRAREFFLEYKGASLSGGAVIGPANTAELNVIATCINFLLINDGSATLRYST